MEMLGMLLVLGGMGFAIFYGALMIMSKEIRSNRTLMAVVLASFIGSLVLVLGGFFLRGL